METQTQGLPAWVHNASMQMARHSGPVTCPSTGCGREFPNEWAGRTHYRLAHIMNRKAKVKKKMVRGPYKKQNKMQAATKPTQDQVLIRSSQENHARWCPNCGTNMAAVNLALKLTGKQ